MTIIQTPVDAELTYEQTAPVYDQLTAHHDYDLYLGNLLPTLRANGLRRGHLLDVACGTGKSFLPMLRSGWAVTGVDVSPAMVERARSKVRPEVELIACDMRCLPRLGEFELVWCLDDSLNYLVADGDLYACLAGFRANLGPGGLCLFDVNTVTSYRGFFASTEAVGVSPKLTWRGHASAMFGPGEVAEATLEIEHPSKSPERALHRQRHYPRAEIEAALDGAGLESLGVFGITTEAVVEQPLDEDRHTKAIYIARAAEGR